MARITVMMSAVAMISCQHPAERFSHDIVIYGGTSAAVMAAVEAVRSGKTAVVVSPDRHLGGMSSEGLGYTDVGDKETIGGLAREFYHRVYMHYNNDSAWEWEERSDFGGRGQGTPAVDGGRRTMWIFEPHVAEDIFEKLVIENSIPVFRNEWLEREDGVKMKDGRIRSIRMLSGREFRGKVFIDATYEGDLMAAAGIGYSVGREACSVYDEQWNGVQANVFQHSHHFTGKIDPYYIPGDPSSGLLPGISPDPVRQHCSGDRKIQAYCFRVCMSDQPGNRVPFPKPQHYDPGRYELLVRIFDSGWREWFYKFDRIPNRKTDTNNHGPFSSDDIGMNYDYPEASYERRKEIFAEHENYQKGLLYFVANDSRVPPDVRTRMNGWGLAADEFTDNGNWPRQLYVRESRRMIGEYVMTENDVLGRRKVPRPVAMGSYTMDSHNVQRYVTKEGTVQNEGDIGVQPVRPYSVSYGSLVPLKRECVNMLVPVCVSASHIAFGSIRMEPVFMMLGQSAAAAASLCIDRGVDPGDLEYSLLREKLLSEDMIPGTD